MGGNESKLKKEFEVEKVLGSGGFGMVIQAKNKYDTTSYAIKLIVVTDQEALTRSKKEVILFSKLLSHQCVVSYKAAWIDTIEKKTIEKLVKDVEMTEDEAKRLNFKTNMPRLNIICIQMELGGQDLRSYLLTAAVNDRKVNERRQWKIFGQIVKGLKHIHDHDIIHRDLKPENIFVGDFEVKIGDLGIAKVLPTHSPTHSNLSVVGTVTHMAPEQFTGHYGKYVDIFALGIILAELFSMVKTREELSHLISSLRCGIVPLPIARQWPNIAKLILRMVEKDPNKRIRLDEVAKEYKVIKKIINGPRHNGVQCDGCGQEPIRGIRYRCQVCYDFDFCETCKETKEHDSSHTFSSMNESDSRRSTLMQLMSVANQSSREDLLTDAATTGQPQLCKSCNKKLIGMAFKCDICTDAYYCSRACLLLSTQHRKMHKFHFCELNGTPAGLFRIEKNIRNKVLLELLRKVMGD